MSELKVSQIKKCGWTILHIQDEIVKKLFFALFPPISLVSEASIVISLPNLVTLVLFYKQHMIKKTSWTFLDFVQSLLIFVA